jgi:hypothetical protein
MYTTLKFLVLEGALHIYDISRLRVNTSTVSKMCFFLCVATKEHKVLCHTRENSYRNSHILGTGHGNKDVTLTRVLKSFQRFQQHISL